MLLNQEQKEINSIGAGLYSSNQESALSKAAARLVVSGTTAIVTAGTAVVSAYNRKVLLHLINRQDVEDVNVRKLPIGKDGILERINYRLDDRDHPESSKYSGQKGLEIWVFEEDSSLKVSDICFAAQIIKRFPQAKISLLISVDLQNARGIMELMRTCKAARFDIETPSQTVFFKAVDKSVGSELFDDLLLLGVNLGYQNSEDSESTEPDLTKKGLSDFSFLSSEEATSKSYDTDIINLVRSHKRTKSSENKVGLPLDRPKTKTNIRIQRKRLLTQISLGLLFIATVIVYQFSTHDPSLSVAANTESPRERILSTDEPAKEGRRPDGSSSTGTKKGITDDLQLVDEGELMALFNDEVVNLKGSGPEKELAPKVDNTIHEREETSNFEQETLPATREVKQKQMFFVQHAAFSHLEGAMIWVNRELLGQAARIHMKGKDPNLFVVLTGPYFDKELAKDAISQGSGAFLVPQNEIGSSIGSVSSL